MGAIEADTLTRPVYGWFSTVSGLKGVAQMQTQQTGVYGAVVVSLMMAAFLNGPVRAQSAPKFIRTHEVVFTQAPFPSAHASTIAVTPSGTLMVAFFGGTSEGHGDVEIWLSRTPAGERWSEPVPVTDTPDMPTWNPVLFQCDDTPWRFFKVGPSPREWAGGYRRSVDGGRT